jgi:hypothetical protein
MAISFQRSGDDLMSRQTFHAFWRNASLSLFAVVILLGALEIGARILGAKPIYGGSASIFVEDPELLWRLRPNCDIVWRGRRAGINSFGFRSPEMEYATSPRPRILVIGDSVTYGDSVAPEVTYPNLLNDMLVPGTAVNAGVPGYGVIQSFGLLRRIWDSIDPDVVIFGYCLNDCHDDLVLTHHVFSKLRERKHFSAQPVSSQGFLMRSAFWSWVQKTRWKREQRSNTNLTSNVE